MVSVFYYWQIEQRCFICENNFMPYRQRETICQRNNQHSLHKVRYLGARVGIDIYVYIPLDF